jgi:hypothetical protein
VDLVEILWVTILASAAAGVEDAHDTVNKPLEENGELTSVSQ